MKKNNDAGERRRAYIGVVVFDVDGVADGVTAAEDVGDDAGVTEADEPDDSVAVSVADDELDAVKDADAPSVRDDVAVPVSDVPNDGENEVICVLDVVLEAVPDCDGEYVRVYVGDGVSEPVSVLEGVSAADTDIDADAVYDTDTVDDLDAVRVAVADFDIVFVGDSLIDAVSEGVLLRKQAGWEKNKGEREKVERASQKYPRTHTKALRNLLRGRQHCLRDCG